MSQPAPEGGFSATPVGVLQVLQANYPDVFARCFAEAAAIEASQENAVLRARLAELQPQDQVNPADNAVSEPDEAVE